MIKFQKNIISFRNFFIFLYKYKIFKRLIPSIIRRLFYKKKFFVNLNNFQIFLNIVSSMDREIYLKGIYDKEKFKFFENNIDLNKFNLFLDIGSYIGYYTLYLGSKYKNLNVLSFEPIIESFSQIKTSKEINNLNNVKIFNYALSNTKEEKKFWCTDLKKKSGFALLDDKDLELNKYDYKKLIFRKIKTEIFDEQFTIKNKLIFVKIDVERHEFEVLLGAVNFLTKSNNKIFLQIEIMDRFKNKVLKLLKNYNFNLIGEIDKGGHDYYLSNYDI